MNLDTLFTLSGTLSRVTSLLDVFLVCGAFVLIAQVVMDFVDAADLHMEGGEVVWGYAAKKTDFDAAAWKRKALRDAETNRRWAEYQDDKYSAFDSRRDRYLDDWDDEKKKEGW